MTEKNKGGRPPAGANKHKRVPVYLEPETIARLKRLIIMSKGKVDGEMSGACRMCIKAGVERLEERFGTARIVLPGVGADEAPSNKQILDSYAITDL